MNPIDIVELIKDRSPELLVRISDKRAVAIVRSALRQIANHISVLDDGMLKVVGLGHFVVRQVPQGETGQTATRRIVFREAPLAEVRVQHVPPAKPAAASAKKEPKKRSSKGAAKKKPGKEKPKKTEPELF